MDYRPCLRRSTTPSEQPPGLLITEGNATKAAIHSFTESIRVQLADTSIQVIEIVSTAVRIALMGQETAENAMPLEDFLTGLTNLLEFVPEAHEILVDNVRFLCHADSDGRYNEVLNMLNGH